MPLQDLTPQLRTRMSRVERLVGLFVVFAGLLMLVGFLYYLVRTGRERGWFLHKVPYYVYTKEATGLKAGDPVALIGRPIGRILKVEPTDLDPWFTEHEFNVFVKFEVWEPYYGYILTDSKVRILPSDFFGARHLEVVPGDKNVGLITVGEQLNWKDRTIRNEKDTNQMVLLRTSKNGVWIPNVEEAPSLAAHVQGIVRNVAATLPSLTNQIGQVLARAAESVSNANLAILQLHPALTNFEVITARLKSEEGAIGRMLLPTNLQALVQDNLTSMNATFTNSTELVKVSEAMLQDLTRRLADTLDSVSLVTSNLAAQVNANGLFLGEVSTLVVNADTMIQGLKQHWFLRSAFNTPTNPPLQSVVTPGLDAPPR